MFIIKNTPNKWYDINMNLIKKFVLIVIPNDAMRSTIFTKVSEYFGSENVYECENEKEAVWHASALCHASTLLSNIVITSYNEEGVNSFELLLRLRKLNPTLKGYIIYDPESNDYEMRLKKIIRDNELYAGMVPVRMNNFMKELQLEFESPIEAGKGFILNVF
jgi:PleD family two-component response regulator